MARMFPQRCSEDTGSAAERKLFDVLRTELSDEWAVLHSLGIGGHAHKPWAEIDFVLIGPPGVYCLEVKGGKVRREAGSWHFENRHGAVSVKTQGPFEQVGSASAALAAHLFARMPRLRTSAVGFGVVIPDVVFSDDGPDVVPEALYDVRDTYPPFEKYLERLVDYWHARLAAQHGRAVQPLSSYDRDAVLEILRGDFDLVPSMKTLVEHTNEELLRLTDAQYRVLDGLTDNKRVLVRGGAGTGKTLLAVEEARRRARAGSKVFYCCYNRRLAEYLKRALSQEPKVAVVGLHSFMSGVVAEAQLAWKIPRAERDYLNEVVYPELAQEALLALERLEEYDVVIIDEAQDLLRDSYLDVLDLLLKKGLAKGIWRVFMDPLQNIFHGIVPSGLARLLDLEPAQFKLSVNCRNTLPVATNTSFLSGVSCETTLVADGPEVGYRWYRDESQQLRDIAKIVNRLLSDSLRPSDIILLSRRRHENSVVRNGLPNVPFPITEFDPQHEPSDRAIPFATVGSFKGLESDAVLMIDVDDLSDPDALLSVYVGASRARAYLAFFIAETQTQAYQARAAAFGAGLAGKAGG